MPPSPNTPPLLYNFGPVIHPRCEICFQLVFLSWGLTVWLKLTWNLWPSCLDPPRQVLPCPLLHSFYGQRMRRVLGLRFSWQTNCFHGAILNIHVQDFWGPCVFNNFGSIARSRIAGSYGNSVFNFLKNCQTLSRVLYKYKDHVFHFISALETVCQDKNFFLKILNKKLEILRTCILSKA